MISLIILSNNILLSLPIALTYQLVSNSSSFQYTKPHSSIVGNRLSYIVLLRSALAAIIFVRKRFFRHLTMVLIFTHQYPIYWDAIFFDSILLEFRSPFIAFQLRANDMVIDPFSSEVGDLQCSREVSSVHTKF